MTQTSMLAMLGDEPPDCGVRTFGRGTAEALISVYTMRMAAVFTPLVSSIALRTRAVPRAGTGDAPRVGGADPHPRGRRS